MVSTCLTLGGELQESWWRFSHRPTMQFVQMSVAGTVSQGGRCPCVRVCLPFLLQVEDLWGLLFCWGCRGAYEDSLVHAASCPF